MKKAYFLSFILFFGITLPSLSGQNCELIPRERVMLVGDSWSQFTFLYKSYERAFTQYGYPDITILGDRTAIGGTRASGWATSTNLELIRMELDSHPQVELVILCVGGNDMVASSGWRKSMNQAQRDSVFDWVRTHIETIVDHIISIRPHIEILLGGYDYMNFVESILNYPPGGTNPYESMWNTLENPDPQEMNIGLGELESRKVAIAHAYPQVQYVNSLGLNHHIYGYPDSLPIPPFGSFAPQTTALPGQAPDYLPLNGGDIRFPSPQIAMGAVVPGLNILPGFDCIHLNEDSYYHYAENQTRHALLDFLKGNPDHSLLSAGADQDGWIRSDGQIGKGKIAAGTDSSMNKTYGFISFDTDSLIPGKQISQASLFLRRDSLAGLNPFTQGMRLDIVAGNWGNGPGLESGDISAQADLEDVACVATLAAEDGYVLRLDLTNDALLHLNPDGLTQFRLVMPDSLLGKVSFMGFLDGDNLGKFEAPRLDIFHGIPTSVPPTPSPLSLEVYPNPTEKMLFLHFPGQQPQKVAYSLMDMTGKTLYYEAEVGVPFGEPISMDFSSLASGIYLLQIQSGERRWVKKILKK